MQPAVRLPRLRKAVGVIAQAAAEQQQPLCAGHAMDGSLNPTLVTIIYHIIVYLFYVCMYVCMFVCILICMKAVHTGTLYILV